MLTGPGPQSALILAFTNNSSQKPLCLTTQRRQTHHVGAAPALLMLGFITLAGLGCGGNTRVVPTPAPTPQALTITAQPSTQAVHLGQNATFVVAASGSEPITYQWNKNGTPVAGANGSSYSVSATVPADEDSTFNVTISNPAGSITSRNSRLLLNPPPDGDLRFQQVDASSTMDRYAGDVFTGILGGISISWGDYGSPFELTPLDHCSADGNPRNCDWQFSLFASPVSGLTSSYQSGLLSEFQNDLNQLGSDTVITSVDVQPANNAYATSWIKSVPAGAFSPVNGQSVLPADFPSVAAQESALGHVITAVSFDAGLVLYVSYGRQNDTNAYETSVASATLDTMPAQAATLAQQGYIITAVGGNPTDGFLLVGTRVQGDTMPRPLKVVISPAEDVEANLWSEGYALIAFFENGTGTAITWIGEK